MVDIAAYPDTVNQIMGKTTENEPLDGIRDLIPVYARIQVPLCDKASIKECAALLRTLGEELRILGDRHDISQTQALYRAWGCIKSANARMQDYTKSRSQN